MTGLAERPTEVEPVMHEGTPAPVDQVRARDATAGPAGATPAAPAAPGQATRFYDAVGGRPT
ncbi:hypothetical protein, partial [Micrococcus luteus]|uniref:hypothetical protein n=1 Tax=Micrococcus luteus TaxID=1270 RepID=UPI00055E4639